MPPFDLTKYHGLLRTERFGRNLIFEPSVGSTMDLARDAAHHDAPEGTLALADEQTTGRGRLGRAWVTPPETNLLSTLLLRPPPSILRALAMIAPIAIVDAVAETTGLHALIKWPNDVQLDGKKLAGILIESEGADREQAIALVGAGINVNFDPAQIEEIRDIATSLSSALGRPVDREALLAAYMLHFERLYERAVCGEPPVGRWRELLATLGQRVTVTEPSRIISGVAEDVDADGSLLVRTHDGALVSIEAGDVTLRT
jgi:BirA family biotin operon repressor/biotin-[acetyl-CoA-carboxylase] ligase